MNYIKQLQLRQEQDNALLLARLERTAEFRAHLQSPKFVNTETNDRNDWIAVADVQRWLNYIQDGN